MDRPPIENSRQQWSAFIPQRPRTPAARIRSPSSLPHSSGQARGAEPGDGAVRARRARRSGSEVCDGEQGPRRSAGALEAHCGPKEIAAESLERRSVLRLEHHAGFEVETVDVAESFLAFGGSNKVF